MISRNVIDLVINDLKQGYAPNSNETLLNLIKSEMGEAYDDFVISAKKYYANDILKKMDSAGYCPNNSTIKEWLDGYLLSKVNLLDNLEEQFADVIHSIHCYAVNGFGNEFQITDDDKWAAVSEYVGNANNLDIEWEIIDFINFKHTELKSRMNEIYDTIFNCGVAVKHDPLTMPLSDLKSRETLRVDVTDEYGLVYQVINTKNYHLPHMSIGVITCNSPRALEMYGYNENEIKEIAKLDIGETYLSEDYGNGVIVLRMA